MGWTRDSLIEFLDRKSIPRSAYSIGADSDEAYCLVPVDGEWLVYYSERGNRNELAWGRTEGQALDVLKLYLLESYRMLAN